MAGKQPAKNKTVWVRNLGSTSIAVKGVDEEKKIEVSKVFEREKTDRITNEVVSRGYTSIGADELAFLVEKSRILQSFIDKGTLVVYEDAPAEAFSDAERVSLLETRIVELEGKLAEALSGDANKKIEALQKALDEQTAARSDLEKEFETYKNQFPADEE